MANTYITHTNICYFRNQNRELVSAIASAATAFFPAVPYLNETATLTRICHKKCEHQNRFISTLSAQLYYKMKGLYNFLTYNFFKCIQSPIMYTYFEQLSNLRAFVFATVDKRIRSHSILALSLILEVTVWPRYKNS